MCLESGHASQVPSRENTNWKCVCLVDMFTPSPESSLTNNIGGRCPEDWFTLLRQETQLHTGKMRGGQGPFEHQGWSGPGLTRGLFQVQRAGLSSISALMKHVLRKDLLCCWHVVFPYIGDKKWQKGWIRERIKKRKQLHVPSKSPKKCHWTGNKPGMGLPWAGL